MTSIDRDVYGSFFVIILMLTVRTVYDIVTVINVKIIITDWIEKI